jgi:ABC-2 type transport system permease protein
MSRAAFLIGHVLAELGAALLAIVVLAGSGLIVGWRIHTGVLHALAGVSLLVLLALAMVWLGTLIGLLVRTPDAVMGVAFIVVFPLTFVANTFAPTSTMPTWLRTIAEWNPVSSLTQSLRELWGNGPAAPASAAWPLQHAEITTIVWSVLIAAVFAPLAVAAFRRRSRD